MKSNYRKLGEFLRLTDERNRDLRITNLQGVSIEKKFIPSIANIIGTDLSSYKIVHTGQFAYGPVTSRNGDKISIALLNGPDCIISSSYVPFENYNQEELLNEYLMLWFMRPEFDRYARFMSNGSAREVFDWECMCKVEMPVPPIEEQRSIVKIYDVIDDRIKLLKRINENLAEQVLLLYKKMITNVETRCKIIELGEFKRGKNITNEEMVSGIYDVISAGIEPSGVHNEYNVKGPSVTISSSGVNAGYFSYHSENIWASDCSYNNDSKHIIYLLCSLEYLKDKIETLKDGHSAQPHVYCKDINQFEVPLIDEESLKKFDFTATIFYNNISNNNLEIKKLIKLKEILIGNF